MECHIANYVWPIRWNKRNEISKKPNKWRCCGYLNFKYSLAVGNRSASAWFLGFMGAAILENGGGFRHFFLFFRYLQISKLRSWRIFFLWLFYSMTRSHEPTSFIVLPYFLLTSFFASESQLVIINWIGLADWFRQPNSRRKNRHFRTASPAEPSCAVLKCKCVTSGSATQCYSSKGCRTRSGSATKWHMTAPVKLTLSTD